MKSFSLLGCLGHNCSYSRECCSEHLLWCCRWGHFKCKASGSAASTRDREPARKAHGTAVLRLVFTVWNRSLWSWRRAECSLLVLVIFRYSCTPHKAEGNAAWAVQTWTEVRFLGGTDLCYYNTWSETAKRLFASSHLLYLLLLMFVRGISEGSFSGKHGCSSFPSWLLMLEQCSSERSEAGP